MGASRSLIAWSLLAGAVASGCKSEPLVADPQGIATVVHFSPKRRFYLVADTGAAEFPLFAMGKKDRIVWTVPGALDDDFLPTDDGRRVVRMCRTVKGADDVGRPAVAIYEDGMVLAQWTVADLVFDVGSLTAAAPDKPDTQYVWRRTPPRIEDGVTPDGRFLNLTTVEGRVFRFDLYSGSLAQGVTARADAVAEQSRAHFDKFKADPQEALRGPFQPRGLAVDSQGNLYFADGENRAVGRVAAQGPAVARLYEGVPGGANGLAFAPDGGLTIALADDARILTIPPVAEPEARVPADRFSGRRLLGPADLIYDDQGNLFFTDPGPRPAGKVGAIYLIAADGRLFEAARNLDLPTGLAMTADAGELIVSEQQTDRLLAFPIDRSDTVPKLGRPRIFAHLPVGTRPAGIARDIHGNIYVAGSGTGRIEVVARDGTALKGFDSGGKTPTHITFGVGRDAEALFVSQPDRPQSRIMRIEVGRVGQADFFPRRNAPVLPGGKLKLPPGYRAAGG